MGANAYTPEGRERRAMQEAEMRQKQVRRVGRPRKTNWLTPAQRRAMELRQSGHSVPANKGKQRWDI